jgi:putative pyruvate formate lyase activating enzyme
MTTNRMPAYIKAFESGLISQRVEDALRRLKSCRLCPRACGVDRQSGPLGRCKTGARAVVGSYEAHFGEEAPLVGTHGSGTIFFSHCNLLCLFCQNYDISHGSQGEAVTAVELARIMLFLQGKGCHNINFVTPSHVVPQILAALAVAVTKGLRVPLVYNTSAYDRVETLELLDGIIDIYMPDFKFWDPGPAKETCQAEDYPAVARAAIVEMHRQVGDLLLDESGLACRGLLVRHLVMPAQLAGTPNIMSFIAKNVSVNTYVNIMPQYRPCGRASEIEMLDTPISGSDYEAAVQAARDSGILRLDRPMRRFVAW